MNNELRTHSGLTLMEMTVVIATIAVLGALGLPAMRTLLDSLESQGSAKTLINGALASARAIAAKEQRYAGVRFQKIYDPNNSLEDTSQYIIFIVHDNTDRPNGTNLTNGFRAVDGLEPIKLPDSAGVMDLYLIGNNTDIDQEPELKNTTTFSVVFSPSGKLVIHQVRARNKNGETSSGNSKDDIFNTQTDVENGNAMFVQDDYPSDGLNEEPSRNKFIIYDRTKLKKLEAGNRWSGYLEDLVPIYINPYTGTMIE
ncbi:MAG: hypothetical protein KAQ89_04740 [Planctomycetes bacterium]|nr:hypothetical protein [Planctomycetota bacterium]